MSTAAILDFYIYLFFKRHFEYLILSLLPAPLLLLPLSFSLDDDDYSSERASEQQHLCANNNDE
jgi:hypothetical protein